MAGVTLRVTNVAEDLPRGHLANVFSLYGNVQRLYVSAKVQLGVRSAVVQFRNSESAAKALGALHGRDWDVQWEPRRARKRAPSRGAKGAV